MEKLFNRLGIKPKDLKLFEVALTHSSYTNENMGTHYERLEFLGDAVLQIIVSEYLYMNDMAPEGTLTKKRAQSVREEALNVYAEKINLADYIRLGKGERGPNVSIVADVFESLMAAIYLDLGYQTVKEVFLKIYEPLIETVKQFKDSKSQLQELVACDGRNVHYETTGYGPSHQREFKALVYLERNILLGEGYGSTKKAAEQQAALAALSKLAKGHV
jgi:ribonuclease-3